MQKKADLESAFFLVVVLLPAIAGRDVLSGAAQIGTDLALFCLGLRLRALRLVFDPVLGMMGARLDIRLGLFGIGLDVGLRFLGLGLDFARVFLDALDRR